MDSAEQAALSESERDASQTNSQNSFRNYDFRHVSEYIAESSDTPKSIRRFEDLIVNLTHSSTLVPSGVNLNGKKISCEFFI